VNFYPKSNGQLLFFSRCTTGISSKVASDYKQFAIQSENEQYYIDNIKFISPTSTGVKTASTGIELIATQGGVSVKNAEGQAIQIYNLAGAKIKSSVAQSSDEVISLSKGIYVVTVGGKSSKVCVK